MTESRYPQAMAHYLSWPPGARITGLATLLYMADIINEYGDGPASEIREKPVRPGLQIHLSHGPCATSLTPAQAHPDLPIAWGTNKCKLDRQSDTDNLQTTYRCERLQKHVPRQAHSGARRNDID
jgi:hypothetical protein